MTRFWNWHYRDYDKEFYKLIKDIVIKSYEDNQNEIFGEGVSEEQKRYFVLSASMNGDSLSMWKYYAKNGTYNGYNLNLFIPALDDEWIDATTGVAVASGLVIYDPNEKLEKIHCMVEKLYEYWCTYKKSEEINNKIVREYTAWISYASLFFKNECFSSEEEMRFVAIAPKNKLQNLFYEKLGGFNNLNEAFGASKLFYDETEGNISCICILDSDYFPRDLLIKKIECASENKLDLYIWKRKEIENYLLEPKVIFRLTTRPQEQYSQFLNKLENLVDSFENEVFDQYAEHIAKYRKYDISTANKEARVFMSANWNSLENKLALVSGKKDA